jgi:Cu-processing system permease protein
MIAAPVAENKLCCACAVSSISHSVISPSAINSVRLLATKEFGDRFRSGWVLACILVWLGAIGLTSFLGLLQIGRIGVLGYERTVISLLNLVQYLVPLLGLLLGHDLIVSENEERTLRLVLAGGISRTRLILGKFVGGCLTLAVPLLLGFALAGAVIGLTARDSGITPFLRLALSGLVLGFVFLAVGLGLSVFARTRVQALVAALLTWCLVVFVFDLVALGFLVSHHAPAAAREIELVCDATHLNAAADPHSAFDTGEANAPKRAEAAVSGSLGMLALNPVDVFRAVNLSRELGLNVGWLWTATAVMLWVALPLSASLWRFHRNDL